MLDKSREKYLFWAFQAVFMSVVFYAGIYLFGSLREKEVKKCYSAKEMESPLQIFMKTLDVKHINSHAEISSDSSDISEDYNTDTSIMYTSKP